MLDEPASNMFEYGMISTSRVIRHFGSVNDTANFFGITDKAVYLWKKKTHIPRERELELKLELPQFFGTPEQRGLAAGEEQEGRSASNLPAFVAR